MSSSNHHYYFQGPNLLSTRNGSTGKFTDHIYLNGQLIAQYDGTLSNVVTGHLSQPIAMFSASGSMVWRGVHNGYDIEVHIASRDLKARFPGQYDILGNGLYYNYHRDYDPSLGRYIQSDPIGLSGGLNTYGYVGANPLMGVDPLGLHWETTDVEQITWYNYFIFWANKSKDLQRAPDIGGVDGNGTTRTVAQTWKWHPTDGYSCSEYTPEQGDQRQIEQVYGEFLDAWAEGGRSWHWRPVVPERTTETIDEIIKNNSPRYRWQQ